MIKAWIRTERGINIVFSNSNYENFESIIKPLVGGFWNCTILEVKEVTKRLMDDTLLENKYFAYLTLEDFSIDKLCDYFIERLSIECIRNVDLFKSIINLVFYTEINFAYTEEMRSIAAKNMLELIKSINQNLTGNIKYFSQFIDRLLSINSNDTSEENIN